MSNLFGFNKFLKALMKYNPSKRVLRDVIRVCWPQALIYQAASVQRFISAAREHLAEVRINL